MLKFKEEKRPGILGLTVVFTEVCDDLGGKPSDSDSPFMITADAGGVRFQGTQRRMTDMGDLQMLAKTLDQAWRAYRTAQPKVTNAAGH